MIYTIDVSNGIFTTYRLKKDGKFKVFEERDSKLVLGDDYNFENYNEAKYWKKQQGIIVIDGENIEVNLTGGLLGRLKVTIRPHRINKPTKKYFTADDVRKVLLNGNRKQYNSLVVDFDGNLHLLPLLQAKEGAYAVSTEGFPVGSSNIGGAISESTLRSIHLMLLEGWETHLINHDFVHQDYVANGNQEDILNGIDIAYEKL